MSASGTPIPESIRTVTGDPFILEQMIARLLAVTARLETLADEMEQQLKAPRPVTRHDPPTLDLWTIEYLQAAGIPTHLLGFGYLTRAIIYAVNHPQWMHDGLMRLYAEIGHDLVVNVEKRRATRVERCIRHAIHRAYMLAEDVPDNSMFISEAVMEWDKTNRRHNARR